MSNPFERDAIGDLLIQHLDDDVRRALQLRAARNGRSLNAEVLDILGHAANDDTPDNALAMIDAIFPPELRLTAEEGAIFDTADHASDAPDLNRDR